MNHFFTKILSITLAFTVLFATTSFSVNMHFCSNKLIDTAVFNNAKVCNSEFQNDNISLKKSSIQDSNCCSNITFIKKSDDNLKTITLKLENEILVFSNSLCYSFINLFKEHKEYIYGDYKSPLLSKNIQVLNEAFLI